MKYACRMFLKAPGFTLVAVLTLALGIGANTAIFAWVNAELLEALPYRQPDRLLALNEFANGRTVSVTYPDYLDWQRDNQTQHGAFTAMAWFQQQAFNLSGAGAPEQVQAADVSGNFFATLGVRPALGREFSPGADSAAAAPEAILCYALWQRQFGGSPSAIGKTLSLDQAAYTVIGVLPASYRDYNQTDLFVPAGRLLKQISDRGDHSDANVIARLARGADASGARAQMQAEMARLALAYPASDAAEGAVVRPIRALFVGNDAPMLWLLLGAVGLVLLIACVNVANLMLARTAVRRQEWAVRAALGAGRGQLLRQLLIESLVLAAPGVAAGVGLAAAGLAGLQHLAGNATLRLSLPVLGYAAGAGVLAAVLFGLVPAFEAGRLGTQAPPLSGSRSSHGHARQDVLVVAEVALALMLAVGAGLMLKSFARLMAVNPGFQPQQVLTLGTSLAGPRYAQDAALVAFEQQALAKLAALPGVEAAGLGTNLPLSGNHGRADVTIVGQPLPAQGHFPHPDIHRISSGYLTAMGLPLLRGRNFSPADGPSAPRVVLVNQQFARQYWPGEDAIGKQIWLGHPNPNNKVVNVVGVVGNTRQYGLDVAIRLEVYFPFEQDPPDTPQFVLRTELPPLSLGPAATAVLHQLDPQAPVVGMLTMNQVVAASVANPRATLWLLGLFGGLALVLAAIGIYGVISYATQQRTNEIGIRMALGADRGAIAQLVGGASVRLLAGGLGVGLLGALAAGRLMAAQLFGVSPADVEVLAGAVGVLFAVGLAAAAAPIIRASRLAPWTALRRE